MKRFNFQKQLRRPAVSAFSKRIVLVIGFVLLSFDSLVMQQVSAQDPENRLLSGSLDLANQGRFVAGASSVGQITIASDDLGMAAAHDIHVAENGFAFLSNQFMIRNNGPAFTYNASSQSHNFDVYYLGTGAFDEAISLPGVNGYEDGSGEGVIAFGGNSVWEATYTRLNGESQVFNASDSRFDLHTSQFSPVTLTNELSRSLVSDVYTVAGFPLVNPPNRLQKIAADNELQWTRSEVDGNLVIERENTLFNVSPVASEQPEPVLDLSGISISGQGTALRDRVLGRTSDPVLGTVAHRREVVHLGRAMVGTGTVSFSSTDTLTIDTSGGDSERTRLTLGAFNESAGGVQATLNAAQVFDSENSTADVDMTANFSADSSMAGTFFKSVQVGNHITGEGLNGETVQDDLQIGYQYSFLEDNEIVAEDITVFHLDSFNAGGSLVVNGTAGRKFSSSSHTAIQVSRNALLSGGQVQTVLLQEGSGVLGEGLAGETVDSASYDIHLKQVQSSSLDLTESGVIGEGDQIDFSNTRVFDGNLLQATSTVSSVDEAGSSRWTFSGLNEWDLTLDAGESISFLAAFDDTGIDLAGSDLGRNYRKSVTFTFEDTVDFNANRVAGTQLGRDGLNRLKVLGALESSQQVTYLLEQDFDMAGASGSTVLAAQTTLQSEGINLTNTAENTGSQFAMPTSLLLLDSEVITQATTVDVGFTSLDDVNGTAFAAAPNTGALLSDIVEVEGLDGIRHTLELTYEPSAGVADLNWFNKDLQLWLPAIFGNSNVDLNGFSGNLSSGAVVIDGQSVTISQYLADNRFSGSYDEYLLSLNGAEAELGAFGFSSGRSWAVIDHNSAFALATAVPEPGSGVVLFAALFGIGVRRRRVNS